MRLISVLAVLAISAPAAANPYEAFIDVESEEDLQDLFATQQITEETYATLIDLFQRGVDLNAASRDELYSLPNLTYDDVDAILAYRAEQGFIRDPADLVGTGALTDDKLLAIAAFLLVRDPFAALNAIHGFVQVQSQFTVGDDLVPPLAMRARILYGRHVTAGVAASMTRLRAGDVVYDPNRDAMVAERPGLQAHVPKAYVAYDTEKFAAIAGTYRIGFGQRLTFDNSSDYTPNGIYRDDQVFHSSGLSRKCNETTGELGTGNSPCSDDFHYVSSDFKWREAMLGVAAGAKHIPLGDGFLQLYGFGSFAPRSIYQYELVDRSICDDARDDDNPACAAPDVIIRPEGDDPLEASPALSYATLPDMYGEAVVGGNATLFLTRRNYLGVTAYGATDTWFVDDGTQGTNDRFQLDFQEWSSRPSGGSFGAVGLNTSVSSGNYDLGAEVTHSFDAMRGADGPVDGGGGPAAVVRGTYTTPKKQELELSVRYFDVDFVNPYGRPIAAGDEFEGQRARNELGTRARYTGRHGTLGLRAGLDVWRTLADDPRTTAPEDVPKTDVYVRADVTPSKQIRWGVWVDFQDKDLTAGGRGQCYDQTFEFDELDEPVDCKGLQLSTTGRLRVAVDRQLSIQGQVTHQLIDSTDYPDGFRQDLSAWASAMYKVNKQVSLRGRVRYLSEDVQDTDKLEESLWTYVDATVRLRKKDRLRVRLDYYQYLDDRDRTQARTPSPEIWLYAMYEAKF